MQMLINNKKLLIAITIILAGILGFVAFDTYQKNRTPQTLGESVGKIIDDAEKSAR